MKTKKMMKASGCLSLAALAALASPCASAFEAGWYGGFGVGESRARIDDQTISNTLLGGGFATTSIADDERDLGYKIFAGYQFHPYLALEGGYFNLGEFGFNAQTAPPGSLDGRIKVRGASLDAVAMWPFTERFSVFLRGGGTYAQTKDHFTGTGLVTVPQPDFKETEGNFKYGAGLEYGFTRALSLRVEGERYRINDAVGNTAEIDLASAGLVYRFGKPAVVAAAAPVYVPPPVVAPVAAPVVMAPPPPPPPVPAPIVAPARVSFSADSLFVFDKAEVGPNGRQALDEFAAQLRGARYSTITVTGHTDAIGKDSYNQKLSEQRAEAVKTYLVESALIAPAAISARGVGETDPVTKPGDCPAKTTPRASAALIACLQADRRVEVEVNAVK